jgi:hypothetical protein
MGGNDNWLLLLTLELAVPLRIEELRGATDEQRGALAEKAAALIAADGDDTQLRSLPPGTIGAAFNQLVSGLAALAYQPGGVTFGGYRFRANQLKVEDEMTNEPTPNYITAMVGRINEELPDLEPQLAGLYALLALTKGTSTTLRDVHDAWGVWMATVRGRLDHPALVPFDELATDVQELDRSYMTGIHNAASSGPMTQDEKTTLTGVECSNCDSEGPHTYWPEDKVAECSSGCGREFEVSDEQVAR